MKFLPLFRLMPPLLVLYGIILTVANVAELRATANLAGMNGTYYTEARVMHLAGMVKSFADVFYYTGFAAIVLAATRYMEEKP